MSQYDFYLETAKNISQALYEDDNNPTPSSKGIMDRIDGFSTKANKVLDRVDDTISSVQDSDSITNKILKWSNGDRKSITSRTNNTILQFPIYISDNINVEIAQTISRAFERMYFSYVQSALSMNPTINSGDETDAKFLRRFHTNVVEAFDNFHEDDIDAFDSLMKESVLNLFLIENGILLWSVGKPSQELVNESIRLNSYINEGFEHYFVEEQRQERTSSSSRSVPIKDFAEDLLDMMPQFSSRPKDPGSRPVKRNNDDEESFNQRLQEWETDKASYDKFEEDRKKVLDAIIDDINDIASFGSVDAYVNELRSKDKNVRADRVFRQFKNVDKFKIKNGRMVFEDKKDNETYDNIKRRRNAEKRSKENEKPAVRAPQMLRDSDVRKINNMTPYTMIASFRIKDKDGHYSNVPVEYVIGVKSILHIVSANELSNEMDDLVTGQEKALQKVRHKTGEIKTKDYLFQISRAKKDAFAAANGKWTSRLKKMASSFNNGLFEDNNTIPNATLVLTNTDVNIIKDSSGYDINKISIARRILNSLYLIGIAIIDPSAGTMKVLLDNQSDWDIQSLSSINAEVNRMQNTDMARELQKIVTSRN